MEVIVQFSCENILPDVDLDVWLSDKNRME